MINNENIKRESVFTERDVKELIRARLENKIDNLPYGFWRCKQGKEHSRIAIRFLVEEHLKISLEEVPKKVTAKTFHEVGLFRLLVEYFDSSYYKALEYAYPGHFKPWHFPKGMTGIWDGKKGKMRAIEAIKHMINDLNISLEDIPRKINYTIFKAYGLGGMLQTLFNSSPYLAINTLYPNKFKPWEFHVKNYWLNESRETAHMAIKWLVEDKLKIQAEDLGMIRRKHFLHYSLGQMLKIFYQNSHLKALNDVYPNFLKQKYYF